MAYPPAKRQRSNTSRDSANVTAQTTAPALRHAQVNQGLSLYSAAAYENGGYSLQPTAHQPVSYNPYTPNQVTNATGGYGGAYQASTAGYGAGPYSPQQQANGFAAHYPQASPTNGHMTPHATHYTQADLNGMRNRSFAETQAQAQVPPQTLLQGQSPQSGTGVAYSPIPTNHHAAAFAQQQSRTNTPTPALQQQQHQQHALSQYADPYPPQPMPHATSYHASTGSYSDSSTLNSRFSPEPLRSPAPLPTPAAQSENAHSPDEMMHEDSEEEDAQGEAADDSTEVYSNPEPPRTSLPSVQSVSTPPIDSSLKGGSKAKKCSCRTGRGDKKACVFCACSKNGFGCSPACSCGDTCGNPFADLAQFFGPSPDFPKPCGPNACFATWLCQQPNVEELDMELMIDILLYDDTSWSSIREYTEPFKKWEESWKKSFGGKRKKKAREDRERLQFELIRGALGNCNPDDFHGYWYSFCQSSWVASDVWEHCQECRICKPSVEWHCDKHNRCTTDHACPDCESAPYASMVN
ncbi:hypothetical protein GGR54DRAFT_375309 [Hypoxylon sp. NC1633]|nr:hypothetical protein GGR54DRAFT_375309 [Hypoxylon sp. NC1633]